MSGSKRSFPIGHSQITLLSLIYALGICVNHARGINGSVRDSVSRCHKTDDGKEGLLDHLDNLLGQYNLSVELTEERTDIRVNGGTPSSLMIVVSALEGCRICERKRVHRGQLVSPGLSTQMQGITIPRYHTIIHSIGRGLSIRA
jgi:hypothetical protein